MIEREESRKLAMEYGYFGRVSMMRGLIIRELKGKMKSNYLPYTKNHTYI